VAGALFLAALVASCFLGAFPPVDLRAVCLVRAISMMNNIKNVVVVVKWCLGSCELAHVPLVSVSC